MVVSSGVRSVFQNTPLMLLTLFLLLSVLVLSSLGWARIVSLMYEAEGLTESRMEMRSDRMINLTLYD